MVGETTFESHLLDGERILWSGRPGQGLMLTPRDGLLIPFSLLWGGFAIVWEWTVLHTKAPGFFPLFGIPFVLVGLYLIAGRFVVDAWLRRSIAYALTDRRILIARSGLWPNVKAISLDRLPEATLSERGGGRGTIRFGAEAPTFARYGNGGVGAWTPALDPSPQFIGIDGVREVYSLLQRQLHAARG